jgi:hypothetical protein
VSAAGTSKAAGPQEDDEKVLRKVENKLSAFIKQVGVFEGKKIPVETAEELIRRAEEIMGMLAEY